MLCVLLGLHKNYLIAFHDVSWQDWRHVTKKYQIYSGVDLDERPEPQILKCFQHCKILAGHFDEFLTSIFKKA